MQPAPKSRPLRRDAQQQGHDAQDMLVRGHLDARCFVTSSVDALANIPMDAHSALSPLFPLALPARSRHHEFLKITTIVGMPLFLLIVGLKSTLVILMDLSGAGQ